jgi:aryl sulfotransferase
VPDRFRSAEEDSARWDGFPFRDGDIVISTRSKSGSTWVQTICALLILQTPELPAPLTELSPWLDWTFTDKNQVYEQLNRQQHRRFIKTHTPLDGLPIDAHASYIVVARHPLDIAVSMYYQGANINRARVRELMGRPDTGNPSAPELEP